jgi:hypothetical protein
MASRVRIEAGAVLSTMLLTVPAVEGAAAGRGTGDPKALRAATAEEAVLALFAGRADEPVRRFRARRRMHAAGLGREACMEVLVELDPESGFRWTVASEGGSELIRHRAFRGILEKEAELRGAGSPDRTALTVDNYELAADGREGDGLVRLRAVPRRRDVGLLDGSFVVTPETADLVRVEGRLVRNPSFWVTRVDVVRHYRRICGHRAVVRIESVSRLRLLGPVRLTVDFDYEMIEGNELRPRGAPAATTFIAGSAWRPPTSARPQPGGR